MFLVLSRKKKKTLNYDYWQVEKNNNDLYLRFILIIQKQKGTGKNIPPFYS